MANRVTPTPLAADTLSDSFTLAACSDWRSTVRRFHVGTGHFEPIHDAGYTTAGLLALPKLSIDPIRLVRTYPLNPSRRADMRASDWWEAALVRCY